MNLWVSDILINVFSICSTENDIKIAVLSVSRLVSHAWLCQWCVQPLTRGGYNYGFMWFGPKPITDIILIKCFQKSRFRSKATTSNRKPGHYPVSTPSGGLGWEVLHMHSDQQFLAPSVSVSLSPFHFTSRELGGMSWQYHPMASLNLTKQGDVTTTEWNVGRDLGEYLWLHPLYPGWLPWGSTAPASTCRPPSRGRRA